MWFEHVPYRWCLCLPPAIHAFGRQLRLCLVTCVCVTVTCVLWENAQAEHTWHPFTPPHHHTLPHPHPTLTHTARLNCCSALPFPPFPYACCINSFTGTGQITSQDLLKEEDLEEETETVETEQTDIVCVFVPS